MRILPTILLSLLCLLTAAPASAEQRDSRQAGEYRQLADSVLVIKSQKRLMLMRDGEPWKVYRVVFGPVPWGPKTRAGDERTPEGRYTLDYKVPDSRFYKAIHISYPNAEDRQRAGRLGVDPGNNIMIHGQPNESELPTWEAQQFNWTNGCIAVSNAEMDEIWQLVEIGTPIEIRP